MTKRKEGNALAALIIAKIVCCGGLVLLATGVLSGLGAWLMDNGVVWLGASVAMATGALWLMRRQIRTGADPVLNSRPGESSNAAARTDLHEWPIRSSKSADQ